MKKASKEVYGKDFEDKMHCIVTIFLTKCKVSTYEAIKRVLSLSMRNSIQMFCISSILGKNAS